MKTLIFAPYGSATRESGLLFLLGAFLRKERSFDVAEVRCSGCFARCFRDTMRRGERGIHSCLSCMGDARALAVWSDVPSIALGTYVRPGDTEHLRRSAALGETLPVELEAFVTQARGAHRDTKEVIRQLRLTVATQTVAVRRLVREQGPALFLVANGRDELTGPAALEAARAGVRTVVVSWNQVTRVVHLNEVGTQRTFVTPLVIDDLSKARRESWSPALIEALTELADWIEPQSASWTAKAV